MTDRLFICSLQGLAVTTTKIAAGEELQGTLPTTALGDALIGPRLASSMTVGQVQEEGVCEIVLFYI